ncbi:MAG: sugar transferase [Planctomycetota bacterium]
MVTASPTNPRTIWGLDPLQLHARYWAQYGVQVVRQGEPSQIVRHAELYLLTDARSLPMFKLDKAMDVLSWVEPQVLFVRIADTREKVYRERVLADERDTFLGFNRDYDGKSRLARVVLSTEREIAQLWQRSQNPLQGWRRLRRFIPRHERAALSTEGTIYDRISDEEVALFLQEMVSCWHNPNSTVTRARLVGDAQKPGRSQVWADRDATIHENARIVGPVWVGAGRKLTGNDTVVGPGVLWDDPICDVAHEEIQWLQIEPSEPPPEPEEPPRAGLSPTQRFCKRTFDIGFTLTALLLSAPLWPLIMLAIYLEDGRPWFFGHVRETVGGREFKCWKFRSMRKDAEEIKKKLIAEQVNEADGPQFFMENDPRLTKVGKFIRKYNLDEFPQFWNVLLGDMSIVGPRPSPHKENQFAPAWREARLSVRPGITGLWQTRRTRRAGTDFQEWIRYDIEYVENVSFWLDIKIIWRTVMQIVRKSSRN